MQKKWVYQHEAFLSLLVQGFCTLTAFRSPCGKLGLCLLGGDVIEYLIPTQPPFHGNMMVYSRGRCLARSQRQPGGIVTTPPPPPCARCRDSNPRAMNITGDSNAQKLINEYIVSGHISLSPSSGDAMPPYLCRSIQTCKMTQCLGNTLLYSA